MMKVGPNGQFLMPPKPKKALGSIGPKYNYIKSKKPTITLYNCNLDHFWTILDHFGPFLGPKKVGL